MNKAILVGRLTRDPELKSTANGTNVCSFSVAVNRRYKNAEGNYDADFINCTAWRQTAEFVSKYFTKGRMIGVVGSIQTRNYDDKDGKKVYVTEVAADEVYFVESKGTSQSTGYSPAPMAGYQETTKPAGFTSSFSTGELDDFSSIASDDGDLPF